jgi:DNA-binding NtrC family response regulator
MLSYRPVLIVSSNITQIEQVARLIRQCKMQPVLAPSLADARMILMEMRPLIIFCSDDLNDCAMPRAIKTLRVESGVPVIALSHLAEWAPCLEAYSAGAFDYIACPPDLKEGRRVVRMALGEFRREHHRARSHAA